MRQTFYMRVSILVLMLASTGCRTRGEAEYRSIQRDSEAEEAGADQRLDEALRACDGDPDCRARAMHEYAAEILAIQARRGARVDAMLENARR